MKNTAVVRCTLCQERLGAPRGWFQLAESRGGDRLMIFRFQESIAAQPGTVNACCAAHVRELVVHWMTMGRLDFPFARSPFHKTRFLWRSQREPAVTLNELRSHAGFVGELAIHRESLTRTLRKNPQALSPMLEALIHSIESDDSESGFVHNLALPETSKPVLV